MDAKRAAFRRMTRVQKLLPGANAGAGPFPGLAEGDALTISNGGMVVKRPGRVVGIEYHILGKFGATAAEGG